ncbi:MAG: hypothetical protein JW718_08720 [Desulfovibrionaceae bacterium]|nr:hypothetical protein [Desulfovibrionaceae bacterium]
MRRIPLVSALVLGLVLGLGLAVQAKDMTADDLVKEAKSQITEISPEQAKKCLDQGGYLCLDCREDKEYKMGHVPGAINLPRGLVEFKIDKKIPNKEANILVMCKTGGRACLTCRALNRMGYKKAVNIAGGWQAWEKAGYPIE